MSDKKKTRGPIALWTKEKDTILVQHYKEGLTIPSISILTGIPVNSVWARIHTLGINTRRRTKNKTPEQILALSFKAQKRYYNSSFTGRVKKNKEIVVLLRHAYRHKRGAKVWLGPIGEICSNVDPITMKVCTNA